MQLLPRIRQSVLGLPRRHWAFASAVVLLATTVEAIGPHASSDALDLLVILGSATLLMLAWTSLERAAPPFRDLASAALRCLRPLLKRLAVDVGVDFREHPPLRRGLPPVIRFAPVVTAPGVLITALFNAHLPHGLRRLAEWAYVPYLLILTALWIAVTATALFLLFLAYALIHDSLTRRRGPAAPRSLVPELTAVLSLVALVSVAALLLPRWAPLSALATAVLAAAFLLLRPGNPELLLVWRRKGARATTARCFDWRSGLAVEFLSVALWVSTGVWLTQGRLLGDPLDSQALGTMPVTSTLGLLTGWIATGGFAALLGWYAVWMHHARRRDPSRAVAIPLRLPNDLAESTRRSLAGDLAEFGFHVGLASDPPRATAVDLNVRDVAPGDEIPFTWPPTLSPADALHAAVLGPLRRQHHIRCRRALLRALEKLFKQAARREFQNGSGFWIAPHLWFVQGLQRDSDEEDTEIREATILEDLVGEPWHRVLPAEARHHFFRTMRSVQLDLLFVEDGVGYRRLRRVLLRLFELSEEQEPVEVEDRHFRDVPGLRVIVHQLGNDERFRNTDYPEPDYEGIGRARILHVYRDRGGEEDAPVERTLDEVPCTV